ncbi:MAG: DUF5611 family protein [Methanolinea sp.]|nr:DUF5611 family protein [Methanolinea sp.]
MQVYPVKRGYSKNLGESMVQKLADSFGVVPVRAGDHFQVTYGALKLLDVTLGKDGKSIVVRTESNTDASDEVILDTNRRFRRYLDEITGFSTKERVKRAKSVESE